MYVVCAPDSFKESMSASDAAAAMERGIRSVWPDARVALVPMADGGEGTCATLVAALGGEVHAVPCRDALDRPRVGEVGFVPDGDLAVIEVAGACGIEHLEPDERDARLTTTAGVGDLVAAALDLGARRILVGLGGSATNDAGTGMMAALGVRFLDPSGAELGPGGAALVRLDRVDPTGLDPRLAGVEVQVACDVDNPLTGRRGASAVFGPQKGAAPADVRDLDEALTRWADVVEAATGRCVRDVPGAGAAGGLGAAFLAFCSTTLESGATLVMDTVGLDAHLARADLVLTGEGSLDAQSAAGKVPVRVAERAAVAGVPTIVLAGRLDPDIEREPPAGVVAAVPIVRGVTDLDRALREGPTNVERATAMTCRLLGVELRPRPEEPTRAPGQEGN